MLPMVSLASSLCVFIISDVVFSYVLLSVKIRLQSCMQTYLLMIVMSPSLSASYITMLAFVG